MPRINIHGVFMNIAKEISELSYAQRRKVGAILVKKGNIIAMGYNGTAKGLDNQCEIDNVTKPEVLHAESNAISKCARSTNSSKNCDLYVTLSPCYECSKLIVQSGIKHVYYREEYRDLSGIDLLNRCGIKTTQI